MPEMDGIEATKQIRTIHDGDSQPTIIAMTAHAFSVIKDEYTEAGMNDFIAKPVKQDKLQQVLERNTGLNLNPVQVSDDSGIMQQTDQAEPILDTTVLDGLRGDGGPTSNAFLYELFDAFLSETPELVNEISYAVQIDDPGLLARNAHQLKSNSATVGAKQLSTKFQELERFGRASDIESARDVLPDTIEEYKILYEDIKRRRKSLETELARAER
jgi:HPt (histidine-containing phosphotransfer) domain-containing protein